MWVVGSYLQRIATKHGGIAAAAHAASFWMGGGWGGRGGWGVGGSSGPAILSGEGKCCFLPKVLCFHKELMTLPSLVLQTQIPGVCGWMDEVFAQSADTLRVGSSSSSSSRCSETNAAFKIHRLSMLWASIGAPPA